MFNRVKEFRKRRGITVRELAILSGYSKGFISLLENNKKDCGFQTLKRIANALEVYPAKLICPCASTEKCSTCSCYIYQRKLYLRKK